MPKTLRMTKINQTARQAGIDACDTKISVTDISNEDIRSMDEFVQSQLAEKTITLEELLAKEEIFARDDCPIFFEKKFDRDEREIARMLISSYIEAVCKSMKKEMLIKKVLLAAKRAFSMFWSEEGSFETKRHMEETLFIIEDAESLEELITVVKNLDSIVKGTLSHNAGKKAKQAAEAYLNAALKACGQMELIKEELPESQF